MNIKNLALISCLAGFSGCYTVPVRTPVIATPVVAPAPVVVMPQPVVTPTVILPAGRPWHHAHPHPHPYGPRNFICR